MALQTAMPVPRRPLPRLSAQRRALRLDPPNTFITGGHSFAREPEKPAWIATPDPALAPLPITPLATPVATRRLPRKWVATVAASLVLHVAVAAFLLTRAPGEDAQIAGGEEAGLLLLGSAPEDQVASGEMTLDEATQVTIVPLQNAKPVETIEAEAVPVATPETAEPVQAVAEAVTAERLEPVREEPAAEATPEPAAPAEPEQARPVEAVEHAAPAQPVDALPEVLAADMPEIVEDDDVVAPVETVRQAPAEPDTAVAEVVPERVEPDATVAETLPERVEPDAPVAEVVPERVKPDATISEAAPEPIESDQAVAEVLTEIARAKRPEPPKRSEPERAEARKPPVDKKAEPAKTAERRAGSGGRNQADARRGRETGDAQGTKTSETGKGKASAAGNAAVTNYPGKVRREISRAVRRISRRDRAGAERDVHVSFTVTASGGLGGVSIARSSGSSALDSAAVAAVRRAAPFPPIPDGAGRRSWQFTIPLGLAR